MRDESLRALELPVCGGGSRVSGDESRVSGRGNDTTRELPLDDPERLGALLRELEPRLLAVALRFTRDPESARDVVQNAFLKVMRHGEKFRGHARVSTWIHRIVANEALMWLRSERRRSELQQESSESAVAAIADAGPGPAETLDSRQLHARLRDGITRLSREERDVVLRCSLSDWSYAEYGARHGIHPAAVKSRAFRARRRLQRLLGEAPPPPGARPSMGPPPLDSPPRAPSEGP